MKTRAEVKEAIVMDLQLSFSLVVSDELVDAIQRDAWEAACNAQREESMAEMKSIDCDVTLVSPAPFPGETKP